MVKRYDVWNFTGNDEGGEFVAYSDHEKFKNEYKQLEKNHESLSKFHDTYRDGFIKLEAENRHLRAKLDEAEAVQRMAINYEGYLQQLHKFREQEAELSRLRDAVPREVEEAIRKLQAESFRGGEASAEGSHVEVSIEYNKVLALIGSLLTTEREKLRGMLEEAYLNGAMLTTTPDFEQLAAESEAYVQKLRSLL